MSLEKSSDFKYCPQCGAEYDSSAVYCADCGCLLTTHKEENQQALSERFIKLHITTDRHQRDNIVEFLQSRGIEAEARSFSPRKAGIAITRGEGWVIYVREEELNEAMLICREAGLIPPDASEKVACSVYNVRDYNPFAGVKGLWKELCTDALAPLLWESGSRRAVVAELFSRGREGVEIAVQQLIKMAQEGSDEFDPQLLSVAQLICRRLAKEKDTWFFEKIMSELYTADTPLRRKAAVLFGHIPHPETLPYLVQLLQDVEEEVRAEAADQLFFLTYEDFGFEPDAPQSLREDAIEKWRAYCRTNPVIRKN